MNHAGTLFSLFLCKDKLLNDMRQAKNNANLLIYNNLKQ